MIITDEEILRTKCVDILPEDAIPVIEKLERELAASANKGIGLAAPQIGIFVNCAIVRIGDAYSVNLVNPKIEQGFDKAIFDNEGCLSFPNRFEKTLRYQEILVLNCVEPYSFSCTGLMAVVTQHECDHLANVLLPDVALAKKITKKKLRPNDPCNCKSGKKYKKCCYLKKVNYK